MCCETISGPQMDSTENKFHDLCRLPLMLMRSIGVDVADDIRWRSHYKWYRYILLVILITVGIFSYFSFKCLRKLILHELTTDYSTIALLATNLIFNFGTGIKIITMIWQQKHLKVLFQQFRNIFPEIAVNRPENSTPLDHYFWPKWTTAFVWCFLIDVSILSYSPLFTSSIMYGYHWLTRPSSHNQTISFPYLHPSVVTYTENDGHPLVYTAILVMETILCHGGIMVVCIDLWAMLFIMHLSTHYNDLCTFIMNHKPQDTLQMSRIDHEFMMKFIQKHTLLLK